MNEKQTVCQKIMSFCISQKKKNKEEVLDEYSEGEDETEFEIPYSNLSAREKKERIKYLWHRAFVKSKGAAHVLAKFGDLNQKIYLYGAAKKVENQDDNNDINIKQKKCVFMPDNKLKSYWGLLIITVLLYTATYVPYGISYIDDEGSVMTIFGTILDGIFFTDIILNFFTAYEDKKVGIEVRHKKIAINYLKSWFLIDLFSW